MNAFAALYAQHAWLGPPDRKDDPIGVDDFWTPPLACSYP
jgi:hypothetical protein